MTTIDNFDRSVFDSYAIRTTELERMNQDLRLDQASTIPQHTQIEYLYPLLSQVDLLMGIIPRYTPWALFLPPRQKNNKKGYNRRRPTFGFFSIAPSLGTLEEQEQAEERVQKIKCNTKEEEAEKGSILNLFKIKNALNKMLWDIGGAMGRLLQG